ncbi:MAG: hypothetical protein ABIS86_10460 [Streptosporangiaceae bacterium]
MDKITTLTGPGGIRVRSVPLTGSYGVWARFEGVRSAAAALEVTLAGGLIAFCPTVESLAGVVDLADLSPSAANYG